MLLKKPYSSIIYLLLFSAAIAAAAYRLPAYASRLPLLLLMALADLYILHLLSGKTLNIRRITRLFLITFNLLPSILLLCFLLSMAFTDPTGWNPVIRTYLLGIVVFLYIVRAFPLMVLLAGSIKQSLHKTQNIHPKAAFSRIGLKISFVLSFFASILLISGMTIWVYDFEITDVQIKTERLPEGFNHYRIVHISDFHLGRWHSAKPILRALELVKACQPDMIVFTGDLVNYASSEALPFSEHLAMFSAPDGVFAVNGNHDYGDYLRWPDQCMKDENFQNLFSLYKNAGWTLLENTHAGVYRGNHCLYVAGTGNYSANKHYPDRSDLQAAASGIPDSCFLILLTHSPEIIQTEALRNINASLVLSGHTHGLQLGFRCRNTYYSPAALIYKHWAGLYQPDELAHSIGYLYVNRGLGHIAIPLRIGMKPEITLITLVKEIYVSPCQRKALRGKT